MNRRNLIRCTLAGLLLCAAGGAPAQSAAPENLPELRRSPAALDRPARRLVISVRFDDAFAVAQRDLGASGRIGSGGAQVEIRARDTRASGDGRLEQRVQAIEGARTMIYTGRSRPIREQRYIQTPAGVIPQQTTVVQEMATGFEIVPRVSGNRAEVDVLASSETRIATTASGPLGEWFLLGAIAGESRRIWIRVEPRP